MKEDIEILEEMIKRLDKNCFDIYRKAKNTEDYLGTITGKEIISVENLLTRYKELEEENRGLRIFKEMAIYRLDVIEPRELISKSKIKEQIKWLDNDIKNTKTKMKEEQTFPNYLSDYRKERMKAYITKSKEIKERLQELLREE